MREVDLIARLARFGALVLVAYENDREDIDGAHVQDLALRSGVMVHEDRVTPCGEDCACAEYLDDGEAMCCALIPDALWTLVRVPGAVDAALEGVAPAVGADAGQREVHRG